ncbi:MAG: aminoacyl-tRNA hydrolase [Bacteroidales bacterium]
MMETDKKFLIVGLGNAEDQYSGTRHNIGFEIVSAIAKDLGVTFTQDRYAYVARAKFKGRTIVLLMPTTYMNLSGKAVRYWLDMEKVAVDNLLIISDDIDLPLGVLKMKPKGGGGSHNGLNHIIEILGHQDFSRIRFGVGKNYAQGYQVDYVLGKFSSEELKQIEPSIAKAVQAVKSMSTIGLGRTMNEINAWRPIVCRQEQEDVKNE